MTNYLLLMSVTEISKVENLLEWLESNSFWNADLVELRPSKIGGTGVFWKLGDNADPEDDNLLLRIPKSNILSPKNSFLYSMLVEYESLTPTVDFTVGMHSIVITFIYEHSMGTKSPWYSYLDSFDLSDEASVPVCLWSDSDKEAMFNSEVDLLNMLDPAELIAFYLECVSFAHANSKYVDVPLVLHIEQKLDDEGVRALYFDKLLLFGRYVQAVISRAFTVDKFFGLSLVPGADLFNHRSPVVEGDDIVAAENVHFVCDDDEGLCEECGEFGCGHGDSDSESELEESFDDESELMEEMDTTMDNTEMDDSIDELMESDVELSSDSESEASLDEAEEEESEDEVEEVKESISMEDIEEIENASEAETDLDDEEVSTLSISEDEDEEEQEPSKINYDNYELVMELSDSSKCCDIVMADLPQKEDQYELFNTYGNELSNSYLLQRYGFVSAQNPNITCLLSVQMFAYLKQEKMDAKKEKQLDYKLEWYEDIGFDLVNEFSRSLADDHEDDEHGHEHGHEHDHSHGHDHGDDESCGDEGCGDGCGDGCCDNSEEEEEIEVPESWQLSPRIQYDGTPTPQTIALVRLLLMPFKVFFHKMASARSERKMAKSVERLLEGELTEEEKALLKTWVAQRLERYRPVEATGERADIIRTIVSEEKAALNKALVELA